MSHTSRYVPFVEPYTDENMAWVSNSLALKVGAAIELLDRMARDESIPINEARLLAYAAGALETTLDSSRQNVARRCAPWFGEER